MGSRRSLPGTIWAITDPDHKDVQRGTRTPAVESVRSHSSTAAYRFVEVDTGADMPARARGSGRLGIEQGVDAPLEFSDPPVDVRQNVADVAELVEVVAAFIPCPPGGRPVVHRSHRPVLGCRHCLLEDGLVAANGDVPVDGDVTGEEVAGAAGLPVGAEGQVPVR